MCVVFSKTPPLTNLSSLIAASPSLPRQCNDGFDQKQRMMAISAQIFHL